MSQAAVQFGLSYAQMRARNIRGRGGRVRICVHSAIRPRFWLGLPPRSVQPLGIEQRRMASIDRRCSVFPPGQVAGVWLRRLALHGGEYALALSFLETQLQRDASDYRLFDLQARTFAATGKRLQQHRAQAGHYYLQGLLEQAIEQLQFAQKETDGDFYRDRPSMLGCASYVSCNRKRTRGSEMAVRMSHS